MATKKPRNTPSTEGTTDEAVGAALYPGALRFRDVLGAQQPLEESLGVKGVPAIVEQLRSPRAIDARLGTLPWSGLVLLEWVAQLGGALSESALVDLGKEHGLDASQCKAALARCVERALLLATEHASTYREPDSHYSLPVESAWHIGFKVRGLTLPESPTASHGSAPDLSAARDRFALLTVSAHETVKPNVTGGLAKVPLKRVAQKLGQDVDELESILLEARRARLLGLQDGLLKPLVQSLRSASSPFLRAADRALIERLDAQWHSVEGLARDVAREACLRWRQTYHTIVPPHVVMRELNLARAQLAGLAGVERLIHHGEVFVRAVPIGRPLSEASGDGHVTPSLEVLLGPACDPLLALEIGLFCELTRIDKVLTFKITPASVTAGRSLGVDVAHMLAMLGKVSRHPLASNVVSMVEDFARSARFLSIRKAQVLEVSSADAAERLVHELGPAVKGRPTPTMILVDLELGNVNARAQKLGISTAGEVVAPPLPGDAVKPPPFSQTLIKPDPTLRARYLAEKSQPAERASTNVGSPSTVIDAMKSAALPREVVAFLDGCAVLWRSLEPAYLAWVQSLKAKEAGEAMAAAGAAPLFFLPLFSMRPDHQAQVLKRSRTFAKLADAMIGRDNPRSKAGEAVVQMLGKPKVSAFYFDALRKSAELDDAEDEDDGFDLLDRFGFDELGGSAEGMLREAVMGTDSNVVPLFGGRSSAPVAASPAPVLEWKSRTRPKPSELFAESSATVRSKLEGWVGSNKRVWLRIRSKSSGERVYHCTIETVMVRGRDVTVLVTDLDEGMPRSFPLANVVAAIPGV